MERGREVRAFDYVNRPWSDVRDALLGDAHDVFRRATRAAASRAEDVAAGLKVQIGGLEVGAPIAITVTEAQEETGSRPSQSVARVHLEWEGANSPRLFPLMRGTLSAYPLTGTETQLEFEGRYEVPGGAVGNAVDTLVGHRIAEASVHRFIRDVAEHLRTTLG
ncbi:MAG: hypothetical protein R3E98_16770 [Gemmatimonadota bacterium]